MCWNLEQENCFRLVRIKIETSTRNVTEFNNGMKNLVFSVLKIFNLMLESFHRLGIS